MRTKPLAIGAASVCLVLLAVSYLYSRGRTEPVEEKGPQRWAEQNVHYCLTMQKNGEDGANWWVGGTGNKSFVKFKNGCSWRFLGTKVLGKKAFVSVSVDGTEWTLTVEENKREQWEITESHQGK